MLYDCFTFFNENDVLEIRLEELWPVVDKFVLVWSDQTFRGNPKPDLFDYERLAKYADKMFFHKVEMPAALETTWGREEWQRNGIGEALKALEPRCDDLIIISDADEIPRRSVVENLQTDEIVALTVTQYSCYINMVHEKQSAVKVLPYWLFTTAHGIRKQHVNTYIEDAGWEFSSLGDIDHIRTKMQSFSHHEFDTPEYMDSLEARVRAGEDIIGRGPNEYHEIDDTWPEAIKANRDYWRKYEWSL